MVSLLLYDHTITPPLGVSLTHINNMDGIILKYTLIVMVWMDGGWVPC